MLSTERVQLYSEVCEHSFNLTDREMVLEVILEKAEWIEEYDDLDNEMTQNLTEKVTAQVR